MQVQFTEKDLCVTVDVICIQNLYRIFSVDDGHNCRQIQIFFLLSVTATHEVYKIYITWRHYLTYF